MTPRTRDRAGKAATALFVVVLSGAFFYAEYLLMMTVRP